MKVKILCGGYGLKTRTDSGIRTKLVFQGECCEVSEEEAARLIAEKMAELAVATPCDAMIGDGPSVDIPEDGEAQIEVLEGTLDPEQLSAMTNAQLKALAQDMGLNCAGCRNKADLVALLSSVPVTTEAAAVEDGERLPEVRAEAPVG